MKSLLSGLIRLAFSCLVLSLILSLSLTSQAQDTFRLHISSEPATLDPFVQKTASGSYLFNQLHSPLLWLKDGQLSSRLAECKQTNSTKIVCHIFKWSKFSNGKPIRAENFVQTFQEFLNPKHPAFRADLLFEIKNARKIIEGKLPITKLAVKGTNRILTIELENPNYEFIYLLANPILTAVYDVKNRNGPYDANWVTSGPYKLQVWKPKQKITLSPNLFQPGKRPNLEFSFITEDTVAMNLYEKGELDLLRRLPTLYIPKYRSREDFQTIDQFRFDFVALSSKIPMELRKALSTSPNFKDLEQLLFAKPRPGCIGLPIVLTGKNLCLETQKINATTSQLQTKLPLTYYLSKQGGDDQNRIAQWFQSEWRKNLNLQIGITELENKIFVEEMKKRTPLIFHKGLAPDRPTCSAILESFIPDTKENYIDFNNKNFTNKYKELLSTSSKAKKQKLCFESIQILLDSYQMIPLGPIYFSILVKPQWKNWTLSELNYLDLSHLFHATNR